ncbi:MAG: hypothetical protein ACP5QR_14005 [Rhizomicrobium sp.]
MIYFDEDNFSLEALADGKLVLLPEEDDEVTLADIIADSDDEAVLEGFDFGGEEIEIPF